MRTGTFPDDDPLDTRGRREVADFLERRDHPSSMRAFSSPMRCAVQTAQAMGLNATVDQALADMDYGKWRGMRISDLAQREPVSLHAWLNDPAVMPPGAEAFEELQTRIGTWIECLTENGRVLAITHAPVIRAALIHALGLDRKTAFQRRIAPMEPITLHRRPDRRWEPARPLG